MSRAQRLTAALFAATVSVGGLPALAQSLPGTMLSPLVTATSAPLAPCPTSRVAALPLPHVRATLTRNHELLIVTLGSSSTVSWMSSNIGHSYPAILQDELNQRLPNSHVAVINRGIGGQGAMEEVPRLDTDVLPIRPQLVIWQVGANDVLKGVDPEGFRKLLLTGISRMQQAGIDVVLMDNQRSPRIVASGENDKIDHILTEVAAQTGADLFARGALMDVWKAEGFPYAAFIAGDGLHHNDRGYRCVADALAQSISDGLFTQSGRVAMQEHPTKG